MVNYTSVNVNLAGPSPSPRLIQWIVMEKRSVCQTPQPPISFQSESPIYIFTISNVRMMLEWIAVVRVPCIHGIIWRTLVICWGGTRFTLVGLLLLTIVLSDYLCLNILVIDDLYLKVFAWLVTFDINLQTLGVGTHMSVWLAYICKTDPHGHLMRRSISKQ